MQHFLLEVVAPAIQPAILDETRLAVLVQVDIAFAAAEALRVPLQVRRHVECKLLLNGQLAAMTHSVLLVRAGLSCAVTRTG